jgi:glycosyltransferase involved in cell wall biosynthesis
MSGFSILICTYNPKEKIFSRLLKAIERLDKTELLYEIIIVDNNSLIPINSLNYISKFLNKQPKAKIIVESNPGLTAARITGIRNSKFDWLVFFDDDNEPESDYLNKAMVAIVNYPQTAAWGPSQVEVEYTGESASWLLHEKNIFQQRNDDLTVFSNQSHWQKCYPYGTGLVIQRKMASLYVKRFIEKRYTLSDRKGKCLSSGGDVQLVLTCIEQGYYAGVVEGLKLNHIIDASKSSISYMQRLQYGMASAYVEAFNQVFINEQIPVERITNIRVLLLIYSVFRIHMPNLTRERFFLVLAAKMGELNSRAEISPDSKPILLKIYERMINLQFPSWPIK